MQDSHHLDINIEKGFLKKLCLIKETSSASAEEYRSTSIGAIEKIKDFLLSLTENPDSEEEKEIYEIAFIKSEKLKAKQNKFEITGPYIPPKRDSSRVIRNAFNKAVKQLASDIPGLVWINLPMPDNFENIKNIIKEKFSKNKHEHNNIIGVMLVSDTFIAGELEYIENSLFVENHNFKLGEVYEEFLR